MLHCMACKNYMVDSFCLLQLALAFDPYSYSPSHRQGFNSKIQQLSGSSKLSRCRQIMSTDFEINDFPQKITASWQQRVTGFTLLLREDAHTSIFHQQTIVYQRDRERHLFLSNFICTPISRDNFCTTGFRFDRWGIQTPNNCQCCWVAHVGLWCSERLLHRHHNVL